MKLIDTDIAIDHFHGHRAALEYFTQTLVAGETLGISVISLTEILAGMRTGEKERTESLLGCLQSWKSMKALPVKRANIWVYIAVHDRSNWQTL